ncbi:hypothetical protein BHU72_00905 [Desulfuribacillus stibiiarsenatis]|uniref:Uncharacterized protein n=1 Tax=Desulfuribacillus stibiiarsenatis TaxID=1390249 RepID=A0A1E5L9M6_9FIRM|nr:hypothetical protein [Desulfuribacillus stibiiarsenatis]OEH86855.1 hypothetical protein BHU72_00905 [Desulfuribacillus stibiiarsenatis]
MNPTLEDSEYVVDSKTFAMNLLLYWFRVQAVITNHNLRITMPTLLLLVVPYRRTHQKILVKDIQKVEMQAVFMVKRCMLGIIVGYFAFLMSSSSLILSVFLWCMSFILILNSRPVVVEVLGAKHDILRIEVCFYEKSHIRDFLKNMNQEEDNLISFHESFKTTHVL